MTSRRTLAGRYELQQEIGRGGMGHVWAALDNRLGRRVAVKTVDLGAAADGVTAARFRQEAQATARLSSPHIVTIFDSGVDGDTAYIVMELLRGPSLEELVRDEGALPVDRALDDAGQVASALAAAHAAGIVHRDIKPSNLMLDGRGGIKVVDFGIARLDQERSSKLTATATVVGSAPYLSPEQATGGAATPQSDLYALGCVLVTLLTGEPPFAGEHPLSVLHQHLSTPPPLPSSRRGGIPEAVDQLVAQLLAKSPADRPASAQDVADRIAAIRRGYGGGPSLRAAGPTAVAPAAADRPTRTMPAVPVAQRPEAAPAVVRAPGGRTPDPQRGGGGIFGWLVAALLVLALLAGGAYLLFGRGGGTPAPTPTPAPTSYVTVTSSAPPSGSVPTESETPAPETSAPQSTPRSTSHHTSQDVSPSASPTAATSSASSSAPAPSTAPASSAPASVPASVPSVTATTPQGAGTTPITASTGVTAAP